MSDHLFAWGEANARTEDPDTSHAAAQSLAGSPAGEIERVVYEAIFSAGELGMTADDVVEDTGLASNTATPRFAPLRRKGLIRDSGRRRPGNSGKKMIIWVAREDECSTV